MRSLQEGLTAPVDPDRALEYLDFTVERHRVWERRQAGEPQPWTDDPILAARKFTNVFRVLDPGTQWPMRHLYYGPDRPLVDDSTMLFRAFMFRYTNRADPWARFQAEHGRVPSLDDLASGLLFSTWEEFKAEGGQVFNSAYRIAASPKAVGINKNQWATDLAFEYIHPEGPSYVGDAVLAAERAEEQVAALTRIPRCGQFLAQQILTDLRYAGVGRCLDEDEFTPLGPGAAIGASWVTPHERLYRKDDGGANGGHPWSNQPRMRALVQPTLAWCHAALHALPECPTLRLADGSAHKPSMMDIQNTLCEYGKYVRFQSRPEPKRLLYAAAHPGEQPSPVLPEHW